MDSSCGGDGWGNNEGPECFGDGLDKSSSSSDSIKASDATNNTGPDG